nr:hypothetical protein GCM10020093_034470 [Planobispora longispora]
MFVGPWVGGLLVGVALAVPFTVDAALFMISGLLVLALPAKRPERPEGPGRCAASWPRGCGSSGTTGRCAPSGCCCPR